MTQIEASRPTASPRRARRYLLLFVLTATLGLVLYTSFMLWFAYSEGERAGVLQKFSKRGWLCKTYEGELALYVVGGIAPQIWHFSVRDDAVAEQLRQAVGTHVRIHYEEHRGLPTNCFGETDYFAERFEVVGPAPVTSASPGNGAPTTAGGTAPPP